MPYREELKIRTSDCDNNLKIKPSSILDLFQETAGRHCVLDQLDSPTLIKKHNVTWVLSGMALTFNEYPSWPNSVTIDTWTKGLTGFKAFRDYSVYDDDGKNIINGSSVWALIDLETRRPKKITALSIPLEIEDDNHAICGINPGKPDIPESYGDKGVPITVNRSDLDLNGHVSNIQYLEWIFTYIDREILERLELTSMNISYRGEAYLGDELLFKTLFIGYKGYHSFINKKTDKIISTISSIWRERV